MSAVADRLLSRLDGVRHTGDGRYIARCSTHEDHHQSLAIRELDDGRLLIHCFAGCEPADVMAAVGLSLSDLYPAPLTKGATSLSRERRPFSALDALRCVSAEALRCALVATDVAAGRPVSVADAKRAMVAAHRISDALAAAGGAR